MPRTIKTTSISSQSLNGFAPLPDSNGGAVGTLAQNGRYDFTISAIFILAVILRFAWLQARPFHNDEGVNGYFLDNLFRHNDYHYDPANYHGPSIYYLTLPFIYLFGTSMDTLRSVTIVFSLITLWLIFCLRSRIGERGVIYASLLFCVSPAEVFFARYFIHETLLVCFTLGIVVTAWDYCEKRKPESLLWLSLCAGLLFATKETAIVECAILAIAAGCAKVWMALGREPSQSASKSNLPKTSPVVWIVAAVIFLTVNYLLYSSFFTNYPGLSDALHSPLAWFKRTGHEHVHPFKQYFEWLRQGDPVLLIIGLAGAFWALMNRDDHFCVFVAFWTVGTILAYSLTGYKTPWLVLNMLLPMAIIGGKLVASIEIPAIRIAMASILLAGSMFYCINENYIHYDDNSYPYVYAQTVRDFDRLIAAIQTYSSQHNDNGQTSIAVASPDYWPLPWYFRRDPNTGFYPSVDKLPSNANVVIVSQSQDAQLGDMASKGYKLQGKYTLRPGVTLELFER